MVDLKSWVSDSRSRAIGWGTKFILLCDLKTPKTFRASLETSRRMAYAYFRSWGFVLVHLIKWQEIYNRRVQMLHFDVPCHYMWNVKKNQRSRSIPHVHRHMTHAPHKQATSVMIGIHLLLTLNHYPSLQRAQDIKFSCLLGTTNVGTCDFGKKNVSMNTPGSGHSLPWSEWAAAALPSLY